MSILGPKSQWLTRILAQHAYRNSPSLLFSIKPVPLENNQVRNTSTTSSSKGQAISINNLGMGGILATPESNKPKLDLSFEDGKTAFKSKSTLELMRGLLVFQVCSINFLIENQKTVSLAFNENQFNSFVN